MKTNLIEETKVHLKRLQNHFDVCSQKYDLPTLLDLCAVLRIFTELDLKELGTIVLKDKSYYSATMTRKWKTLTRRCEYLSCYLLLDGVETYTHIGSDESIRFPQRHLKNGNNVRIAANVKYPSDGKKIKVRALRVILDCEDDRIVKENMKYGSNKANIVDWLERECARVQYYDDKKLVNFSITRTILIKRLANTKMASHALNSKVSIESANRYDQAVNWLTEFCIGDQPLSYFILLHTAQEILTKLPKALELVDKQVRGAG